MGIALNTAGIKVSYAVESTKGTRPTTGYTAIPDLKETPEMNPSPETLDSTTFDAMEYKTFIQGLKDLGGALAFKGNYTEALQTAWAALVSAYQTGKTSEKSTWFQISHPQLKKAFFFTGEPSAMGLPSATVNQVYETSVYVTPTSELKQETKIAVD